MSSDRVCTRVWSSRCKHTAPGLPALHLSTAAGPTLTACHIHSKGVHRSCCAARALAAEPNIKQWVRCLCLCLAFVVCSRKRSVHGGDMTRMRKLQPHAGCQPVQLPCTCSTAADKATGKTTSRARVPASAGLLAASRFTTRDSCGQTQIAAGSNSSSHILSRSTISASLLGLQGVMPRSTFFVCWLIAGWMLSWAVLSLRCTLTWPWSSSW